MDDCGREKLWLLLRWDQVKSEEVVWPKLG